MRATRRRAATALDRAVAWLVLVALASHAAASPAPVTALAAFGVVEGWVRSGELAADATAGTNADGIEPDRAVHGVAVTLTLGGRIVGEGSVALDPLSAAPNPTAPNPTAALVRDACRSAIAQAAPRVGPPGDPAWARVMVSLELAGPLVPFAAEQLAQASVLLSPGVEGVGARLGDRTELAFPAGMLARSQEPGPTLASLVVELSGEGALAVTPLDRLRARGFEIYRFRSLHAAQLRAGGPPIFLHRGGRVVPAGSLGVAGMRTFTDGLARHLQGRRWPGVEPFGMLGTIDASTGRIEPRVASPAEQAIAALALQRYAGLTGDADAERAARRIIDALADIHPSEPRPFGDATTAAAVVVTLTSFGPEVLEDDALLSLYEVCRERLRDAFDGESFDPSVPPGSQALIAWALIRSEQRAEQGAGEPVNGRAALRAVFRGTPRGRLVGQMPWVVYAAQDLAGDGELPQALALRRVREQLWQHQLRSEDLQEGLTHDLAGGIVFTAGGSPLPTWQLARPIAGAAAMLGDDRLTLGTFDPAAADNTSDQAAANERPIELARLAASLRFLRQLAGDESHAWMERRAALTRWGVRTAPWDQRQPTNASSLTLLALVDTLRAIDAESSIDP